MNNTLGKIHKKIGEEKKLKKIVLPLHPPTSRVFFYSSIGPVGHNISSCLTPTPPLASLRKHWADPSSTNSLKEKKHILRLT